MVQLLVLKFEILNFEFQIGNNPDIVPEILSFLTGEFINRRGSSFTTLT